MPQAPATDAMRLLSLTLPVVQGPFGGGLSTARLAATVADLGGLGSYGAHHLPADRIGTVADEIRALTSGAFGAALPTVQFRRPDGAPLGAGDPGVTHRRLSSVLSFEVLNPSVGVWTAEFTGDDKRLEIL